MTYNIPEAIKAQEQFCDKNEYPCFAPDNGIYSENGRTRYGRKTHGISVESAGNYLITGCPFCSRSYCD